MVSKFNEEWAIRHGVEDSSDLCGVTLPRKEVKIKETIKDYDIEWKKYLKQHPDLMMQKKE